MGVLRNDFRILLCPGRPGQAIYKDLSPAFQIMNLSRHHGGLSKQAVHIGLLLLLTVEKPKRPGSGSKKQRQRHRAEHYPLNHRRNVQHRENKRDQSPSGKPDGGQAQRHNLNHNQYNQ